MRKFSNLFFIFGLLLIIFSSANAQRISCKKSDEWISGGSTFFLRQIGTLKNLKGKVIYPDGTPAPAIIEIYKNQFRRNEKIDNKEIEEITTQSSKITVCDSDEKGKFKITGLEDGFYLIRIGTFGNKGFGPENILVEISRKKGKKKKLEIDLGQAI